MTNTAIDYRLIIRDQFNYRCKANPRYSLRAFARDLNISCARLSLILNGKRGLSVAAAQKIAVKLSFSESETSMFCDLVQSKHARSQAAKEIAITRLQSKQADIQGRTLQLDAFKVISDWHHFAILQLMHLKQFQSNVTWISKALEIQHTQTEEALERLTRLGLIKKEDENYQLLQDYIDTPDEVPSEAIRKFHRQILEKAMTAIEMQSVEERDCTSMMLPIEASKLPLMKERIRKFRQEICREFTTDGNQLNVVYSLSIQCFRVGCVQ